MTETGTAPEGGAAAPEGQGQQSGGGIFDPYLQAVPEDAREYVGKYLSDAEKNVNSRLAEAADIQKRFGPYSEIDLASWEPERLSNTLAWVDQMTNDDAAFKAWLQEAAQEAGLLQAQEPEMPDPADLTPEKIQEIVSQAIQDQIAPLQSQNEQRAQLEQTRELEGQINNAFSAIEKEHGITLTDDQKIAIGDLGESHKGDDWIDVGFKRFQALTGQAQADLVNKNQNQPPAPIKSGGQEAPSRPVDWKAAGQAAEERLRTSLAT